MRKPLERNKGLQFVNCNKVDKKAEEYIGKFFDEFPEVDCRDLMYILMSKGNLMANIRNIADNDAYVDMTCQVK